MGIHHILPLLILLLAFFSTTTLSAQQPASLSDFQALLSFKREADPYALRLRSWNGTRERACSGAWAGVVCANGEVVALQLPFKGLSGQISARIGVLRSLRRISLHDNFITGTIPSSIAFLPNLRGLHLFNNRLSGSIPPSIGANSSLMNVDLSNNLLIGIVPVTVGDAARLYRLNLSSNSLSGPIPGFLAKLSSLTLLDFSHNNFTGGIPGSLSGLQNLTSFNVSHNRLSGEVPIALSEKFTPSSFIGNPHLCGFSSSPCPSSSSSSAPSSGETAPSPGPETHNKGKLDTKDIVLILVGAILVLLLLLCCVLLVCLIRKRAKGKEADDGASIEKAVATRDLAAGSGGGGSGGGKLVLFDGPLVFSADDLLCATAEVMGKNPYGTVYKATLEDGSQVAVKRLREKLTKNPKEFEIEAAALGRIRHPNLLPLRAYYLGPKAEKLLVFDSVSKGSLSSFLHGHGPETTIDWPTRMKIAMGITRGLHHLHTEENMTHGSLTASEVFLDERNEARVSDYGVSRLMTDSANTNVIATSGSMGYRAPELQKTKKATTKSDIYSLGVIMLELLTGKAPGEQIDGADLPQWVASTVKEEWTNEVFDLELMRDASATGDEMLNTLKLALHLVDPSPEARPEVGLVLQQLEEINPMLAVVAGEEKKEMMMHA